MNRFFSLTPKCEILVATQELIDALLSANIGNRKLRATHRAFLRQQIEEQRYTLTNQGIGIDINGDVIDGQHRLFAIRDAGYPPVMLLIVYGLPVEARAAIDTGIVRTFSDLMHFAFDRPEATATMIATARFWGMMSFNQGRKKKPSGNQICEWYMTILPALERILAIPMASKLSAPVLAAIAHRLIHVPGDDRPLLFVEKLISGAGLGENAPALRLRNWLAENKGGAGDMQLEKYNRTVTALTAHLQDRSLSKLYARRDATEAMIRA